MRLLKRLAEELRFRLCRSLGGHHLEQSSTNTSIQDSIVSSDFEFLGIGSENEVIGLEFSNLLRSAHAINKSHGFVERVRSGKEVYFFRCESGPYRAALHKTLNVMRNHNPSFSQSLILTEGPATEAVPTYGEGKMFFASGALIEKLATNAGAKEIGGIGELEQLVEFGDREARHMSLSARSLATEVIFKAAQFSKKLADGYETLPAPVTSSCLVTSLYDEQNLIRLIEYLTCVVENLRVFERIVIYYEMTDGLLAKVLHEISEELAIAPGRLLLLPFQKRPKFEDLFSVQTLLPSGTVIAVANADVAFDASLSKIGQVDLSQNIIVLSRRNVSQEGTETRLIHLNNGVPNTFSSDAWITSTPIDPDFFLDYLIGTMHCDSFINYQVSKSARYRIINPCLDIRIFHLHDERFNSSTEKAQREAEAMKKNYNKERERNGGEDPIRGVAWSTLTNAAIVPGAINLQRWIGIGKSLILHLGKCAEVAFGQLLILHLLCYVAQATKDSAVTIRLRKKDLEGPLGILLARYQTYFSLSNFLLDLEDEDDLSNRSSETTVARNVDFESITDWVTKGSVNVLKQKITELLIWPPNNKFLRCDLTGNMSTEATIALLNALQQQEDSSPRSLIEFFNELPDYSAEKNMVTSFIVPQLQIFLR